MAARRFRPLTADRLDALPELCAGCTFWESSLRDLTSPAENRDSFEVKRARATEVTERWGYCGVLALEGSETIGFLTMAPATYVPRLSAFATTSVNPDAAVLMSAWVAETMRGKGIGRQLIQSAAALLVRRDIRTFEAVGTYRPGPSCMLPVPWLESVGFVVVRPHPVTPRVRMNLQSTVRWRPDLGAALERLTGLVKQPAPPEPATFTHRDAS